MDFNIGFWQEEKCVPETSVLENFKQRTVLCHMLCVIYDCTDLRFECEVLVIGNR